MVYRKEAMLSWLHQSIEPAKKERKVRKNKKKEKAFSQREGTPTRLKIKEKGSLTRWRVFHPFQGEDPSLNKQAIAKAAAFRSESSFGVGKEKRSHRIRQVSQNRTSAKKKTECLLA